MPLQPAHLGFLQPVSLRCQTVEQRRIIGRGVGPGSLERSRLALLNFVAESIEPAPEFGLAVPLDYIQGMGKAKDKVVVLLDVGEVLDARAAVPADVLEAAEMRRAA